MNLLSLLRRPLTEIPGHVRYFTVPARKALSACSAAAGPHAAGAQPPLPRAQEPAPQGPLQGGESGGAALRAKRRSPRSEEGAPPRRARGRCVPGRDAARAPLGQSAPRAQAGAPRAPRGLRARRRGPPRPPPGPAGRPAPPRAAPRRARPAGGGPLTRPQLVLDDAELLSAGVPAAAALLLHLPLARARGLLRDARRLSSRRGPRSRGAAARQPGRRGEPLSRSRRLPSAGAASPAQPLRPAPRLPRSRPAHSQQGRRPCESPSPIGRGARAAASAGPRWAALSDARRAAPPRGSNCCCSRAAGEGGARAIRLVRPAFAPPTRAAAHAQSEPSRPPTFPGRPRPLSPSSDVSKQSRSLEALGACDWLLLKEAGRADWTVWSVNHHGQRRSLEESASHARVCRCSNLKASSVPRFAPAGPRCVSKRCCSS